MPHFPFRHPAQDAFVDTQRIIANGLHNAFCGFTRWRDRYWLSYREAQTHDPVTPGVVRIWESPDARSWTPAATLATGGDDRDPHLLGLPDRLLCVWGTQVPRWGYGVLMPQTLPNSVRDLVSHVSLSRDGRVWSTPAQVHRIGYWLWSVLEAGADGYVGAAYHGGTGGDRSDIFLLDSTDSLNWRTPYRPSFTGVPGWDPCEPALARHPETQRLVCAVRVGDWTHAQWGVQQTDVRQWVWQSLGEVLHAPAVCWVAGTWVVAGRVLRDPLTAPRPRRGARRPDPTRAAAVSDEAVRQQAWGRWVTAVGTVDPQTGAWQRQVVLPSGGDTSYPGLWYDAEARELLVVYYSQHDRAADLAQEMPLRPADIYMVRLAVEGPVS